MLSAVREIGGMNEAKRSGCEQLLLLATTGGFLDQW